MSKYPGNILTDNAPAYNPASGGGTPGLWSLNDAAYAAQNQSWNMYDPYWRNTTLLLNGENAANAAQNNTFLDSSTNNFTITRNGNTTQGTFSPYGNLWSNYFDGSGDLLRAPYNAAFSFGTGSLTLEAWVYLNSYNATYNDLIGQDQSTNAQAGTSVGLGITPSGQAALYASASTGSYVVALNAGSVPLNQWVHLAGVRNGNSWNLYVNGISVASTTSSVTITQDSSSGGICVGGSSYFADYYISGYISNVRVVKGTAVYTSNFTPSTTPLTAITNTSLLTCQSNRFIDNSSNNFAITRAGDTKVTRFSPFNPTTPYSASTTGGSGYFDGTGDYLSAPNGSSFTFTGDFTVECWVYPTSATNGATILDTRTAYDVLNYSFYLNTSTLQPRFINSSGVITTSSINPTLNQWNHIAYVRSGSTIKVYVNGVEGDSDTLSGTLTTGGATTVQTGGNALGSAYFLTGSMTDLRVVNGTAVYTSNFTPPAAPLTAITNTSLLCNFTNAGIPDAAMQNDLETVGNAQVSTSVKKYGTGSLAFDGSGDYLLAPTSQQLALGGGNWTVELWLNATASGYSGLVSWRNANVSSLEPDLYLWNTGVIVWYANTTALITGTTNVVGAGWVHVAVCKNNGSTKLFINGVQEGSTYTDTNTYLAPNVTLKVGAQVPATQYLNGYIDDLRITKGVARYTANFTPPTSSLQNL